MGSRQCAVCNQHKEYELYEAWTDGTGNDWCGTLFENGRSEDRED